MKKRNGNSGKRFKRNQGYTSRGKSYNTPPELWLLDDLDDESFDVTEYYFEDDDGNEIIPESAEEVRQLFISEFEKESEEFANREPLDSSETADFFEERYNNSLREVRELYPKWMSESVDPRLIALGLLPKTAYNRHKDEIRKAEKEFKRIEREYNKVSSKQHIPEDIEALFDLHDACLFSLKKVEKDYVRKTLR